MTPSEELNLQDVLTTHLVRMTGVQKTLLNARDGFPDYAVSQMLSEAILSSIEEVAKAMPEEWRNEIRFINRESSTKGLNH